MEEAGKGEVGKGGGAGKSMMGKGCGWKANTSLHHSDVLIFPNQSIVRGNLSRLCSCSGIIGIMHTLWAVLECARQRVALSCLLGKECMTILVRVEVQDAKTTLAAMQLFTSF